MATRKPQTPDIEPDVQDVDEPTDSTDVQEAPDEGVTEPHVEGSVSTASHYDPQGHPVTIAPALHEYHQARGYTPISDNG